MFSSQAVPARAFVRCLDDQLGEGGGRRRAQLLSHADVQALLRAFPGPAPGPREGGEGGEGGGGGAQSLFSPGGEATVDWRAFADAVRAHGGRGLRGRRPVHQTRPTLAHL